jgi:hypothetical protein
MMIRAAAMVPFWKQSERLNNKEIMPNILFIAVIALIIGSVVYTFFSNQKIAKNSIEADAVVSRIHIDDRTGGS